MKIKIKRLHPDAVLPVYAHGPDEDAGMDLRACVNDPVSLLPGQVLGIPTGVSIELPAGYEGQVRTRSGMALKHQIIVLNSPGTIDPGYRGEIKVILKNLSAAPFTIANGDRIAQLVIARYEAVEWDEGDLGSSVRGSGGFGSSGIK